MDYKIIQFIQYIIEIKYAWALRNVKCYDIIIIIIAIIADSFYWPFVCTVHCAAMIKSENFNYAAQEKKIL